MYGESIVVFPHHHTPQLLRLLMVTLMSQDERANGNCFSLDLTAQSSICCVQTVYDSETVQYKTIRKGKRRGWMCGQDVSKNKGTC